MALTPLVRRSSSRPLRLARFGRARRRSAIRRRAACPSSSARSPSPPASPASRAGAAPVDADPAHRRRGDAARAARRHRLKDHDDAALPDRPAGVRRRRRLRRRARRAVLGELAGKRRPLPSERPRERRLCAAVALLRRLGRRPPRWRWRGLAIGIAAGLLFSVVRIVQGAQFASATLWSAVVDWTVCAALFLPLLCAPKKPTA